MQILTPDLDITARDLFAAAIAQAVERDTPVTITIADETFIVIQSETVDSLMQAHYPRLIDAVMREFYSIHLTDARALIDFFWKLTEVSDQHPIAEHYREAIVPMLESSGYVAHDNTGSEFDPSDRDNVARYVIGQAMAWLHTDGIMHAEFIELARTCRELFAASSS